MEGKIYGGKHSFFSSFLRREFTYPETRFYPFQNLKYFLKRHKLSKEKKVKANITKLYHNKERNKEHQISVNKHILSSHTSFLFRGR